ncbi:hypothetical protein R75461_05008 [Paraburkholderia nemoris]|uniref:SMI1/KNR4 family protein n=1 Tax=Paraburkholderia TaxID=1822464 RepID=UPI00190AD83B|nr:MULTISPECIES: SMI1/KNR4 family protein [Paraburkholderia]MBK3780789.1 SMI1/KNR4 family protein [Paraburkholderia aspalathi]CAE6797149.1 hypothetical protein R75461_05008 [Paraburkholderia nemoris]
MQIKLNSASAAPSDELVANVEAALNLKLPMDYLHSLKEINGAVPESNMFDIPGGNNSGVNQFILLDRVPYEAHLVELHGVSAFLPIAYAEGGNYVCISASGMEIGSVYFLDHEIPGLAALTKLASSISEFLQLLRPSRSDDVKLKPGQVKRAWIDPDFFK